jgi:hypothetical protein
MDSTGLRQGLVAGSREDVHQYSDSVKYKKYFED